jgi:hypothetical protein
LNLFHQQQHQMFARQLFGMQALAARLPAAAPPPLFFQPCGFQQQQQYFTFGSTPSSPTSSGAFDCFSDSEPLSPLPQKFPPVVKNLKWVKN